MTNLTRVELWRRIRKKELTITMDELGQLILLVDNPFQDIDINWEEKKVFLKGSNVWFGILEEPNGEKTLQKLVNIVKKEKNRKNLNHKKTTNL